MEWLVYHCIHCMMVEISCTAGSSLSVSAVYLTLMETTFLQDCPVKDHLAMG